MTGSSIDIDYAKCLEDLPGLHYVAELHGVIRYISEELREMLDHSDGAPLYYTDLFSEEDLRQVKAAQEKQLVNQKVHIKVKNAVPGYVEHLARIVKTQTSTELVLGTIRMLNREYELQQEVEVLKQILNRPEIPFGVHFVERATSHAEKFEADVELHPLSWVNNWSERRFFPSQKPSAQRFVCDLAGPDDLDPLKKKYDATERRRITQRVEQKFNGSDPSDMQPRMFLAKPDQPDHAHSQQKLPFVIKDFFIYDSPMAKTTRHPIRIGTVVFETAIQTKLVNYLTEKTARSPILETLGIRAFEKLIDGANPIRFQYLNNAFREDYHVDDSGWAGLLKRFGIDLKHFDKNKCWDALLEKGIGDVDLYPSEIATQYNADDMTVYRTKTARQGLERHPDSEVADRYYMDTDVQFLKVPLEKNGTIVGVSGFYWRVRETHLIEKRLTELLAKEKDEVLDCLPDLMRVVRKDRNKRILFVNKQHAEAHKQPTSFFVGRTDGEINDFEPHLVVGYAADDDYVINEGKSLARYELHKDGSSAAECVVVTIKSPIRSEYDYTVAGVQCLYWKVDDLAVLLKGTKPVMGGEPSSRSEHPHIEQQVFVSYSHKDSAFLFGGESGSFEFKGLATQLNLLNRNEHSIWWADKKGREDRFDDEIANMIRRCRIFVLLMSGDFWDSEYIKNKELPHIQMRRCSDPAVQIIPVRVRDFVWPQTPVAEWVKEFKISGGVEGDGHVQQLARGGTEEKFWTELANNIRVSLSGSP